MLWNGTEYKNYDELNNALIEDYERGKESEKYALKNIYSGFLQNIQRGDQVEESKAFLASMMARGHARYLQKDAYVSDKVSGDIQDDILKHAYKYPDFAEVIADSILDNNPNHPDADMYREFGQRSILPEHLHKKIVNHISKFGDSGGAWPWTDYMSNPDAPWTVEDVVKLPKTQSGDAPNYLTRLIQNSSPEFKRKYTDYVLSNKQALGHTHLQALFGLLRGEGAGIPKDTHNEIVNAYFDANPDKMLNDCMSWYDNPFKELTDEQVSAIHQKALQHVKNEADKAKGLSPTPSTEGMDELEAALASIDPAVEAIHKFYKPQLHLLNEEVDSRKPENRAANFWYDYERKVDPEHFALAKTLYTNQPETLVDHRGKEGSSDKHASFLDFFRKHAQDVQQAVTDKLEGRRGGYGLTGVKKNGKWHIEVYRGVSGDYATAILNGIRHPSSTEDDLKLNDETISVPSAHLSSWSADPQVAKRFASRNIANQSNDGVIIHSWMPVDKILHSGFIPVADNQKQAHPHEREFVFHHPESNPTHTIHTKDIQVMKNGREVPVQYVPPEEPKTEDMNKTEYPMPKPEMENNVAFVQKHGKHLFEQLPLNKRMGLMSLMEACDIPKNHPHYYGIIVNKPFDYIKSQPFREHLNQKMGLDDFDSKRMYTQMQEATSMIKQYAEDTVHDPVNDTFHQSSSLKTKFKKHDEHDTFLRPMSEKAKDTIISWGHKHGAEYEEDKDVVGDMVGAQAKFDALIEAAKFVAGRKDIPLDRMRHSFVLFEDDIEAAALHAAGLKDTEANRTAIREVAKMADFVKFDTSLERPKAILPTDKSSKNTAEEVNSAFDSGDVQSIKLTGKHSKGTLIARDPKTHHVWLIKPGSGATSPAAGVAEETASQSAREAAFSHVARLWHLGNVVVKAEMLKVDGQEWAALAMLPYNYQNADKWKTQDYAFLIRTLDSYRAEGTLHKLAVLDFVLGNPDRHAQNVMVSKEGQITMIDHGSAFAGSMFSPDKDTKSFVPFYLRYNTREFNKMDRERKLAIMPKMPRLMHKKFVEWIGKLDASKMAQEIQRFGISPAACLKRLEIIKALPHAPAGDATIDEMVNALWLDT